MHYDIILIFLVMLYLVKLIKIKKKERIDYILVRAVIKV